MKRHYVTYTERWEPGPMRYWVHQPADGDPAYRSMAFEPPVPGPIPGKGYPHYHVEVDGFTFEFASLDELDACTELLSRKHLPSTYRLTRETRSGPNSHWLSRLPGNVKSWRYREKATEYMRRARHDFQHGIEDSRR